MLKISRTPIARACVARMSSSSSSAPTKTSSSSSQVSKQKPTHKRESLKSFFGALFNRSMEAADPNQPPIPMDKIRFADTTEHATGEEKLFLLAFENGIIDPYCNLPAERNGRGTKDNPVKVEAWTDERVVACTCEPTQSYVKYTTIYRGEPKRCQCGHWIELVDAPKFWEKIPKEDLEQIPNLDSLIKMK